MCMEMLENSGAEPNDLPAPITESSGAGICFRIP